MRADLIELVNTGSHGSREMMRGDKREKGAGVTQTESVQVQFIISQSAQPFALKHYFLLLPPRAIHTEETGNVVKDAALVT